MKIEVAIVGIPRCGTTFLYRSIAGLLAGELSPEPAVYKSLPMIKAHSLAPPDTFGDPFANALKRHMDGGGKVIFLFGDPVEAIISTRNKRWNPQHALHCGYRGNLKKTDIYAKDYFHYEKIFDSWMNTKYRVLCARYETMCHHFEDIEKYLGREIKWNRWVYKRINKDSVDASTLAKIERTYARLSEKILLAKDFEIKGDV